MEARAVEHRFPNGDFEIVMTPDVPTIGATITALGRRWTVVEVREDALSVVVTLEPAEASHRAA